MAQINWCPLERMFVSDGASCSSAITAREWTNNCAAWAVGLGACAQALVCSYLADWGSCYPWQLCCCASLHFIAKRLSVSPWSVSTSLFKFVFWFSSTEIKALFYFYRYVLISLNFKPSKSYASPPTPSPRLRDSWGKAWCIALS